MFTASSLRSGSFHIIKKKDLGWIWVVTGVGPQKSEEAISLILSLFKPIMILNIGTAGYVSTSDSKSERLDIGSLVWANSFKLVDDIESTDDSPLLTLEGDDRLPHPSLYHLNSQKLALKTVHIPKSINSTSSNQTRHTPYIVDMEAFSQANHCAKIDISFHCLKFISDCSDKTLTNDYSKNLSKIVAQIDKSLFFLKQKWQAPTVIIPTYNRAEKLLKALNSVVAQTVKAKEIIIVDDGSTDDTKQSVETFISENKDIKIPITYSSHNQNKGISEARNTGIAKTDSDWICLLDSDDLLHPDKFESDKTYFNKHPYYQIYQSEEKWIRNGKHMNQKKIHQKPLGWAWERSLKLCLLSSSGLMIHKTMFEQFGLYDPTLPACEDYDLWIRILRKCPVGLNPSVVVTKFGGHDDQLSQKYDAMDTFRVEAMVKSYNVETDSRCQNLLKQEICTKLTILLNGAKKRKNDISIATFSKQLLNFSS
ncbi:glycosyltransferase [bacterium]|nr:glycosyltransferase [bacterium]